MISYGRQDITEEDIDLVTEVLKSDFLTQGNTVPEFESDLTSKFGSDFAVAVNSATSALHIACKALGLSSGDILWTSPITFVASANCALYCGARVDFVDIDPSTFNISIESLKNKLRMAEQVGELPKILVVVHMAGQSSDMAPISELAKAYDFKVIEDASHAIGGEYFGERIGSCKYSDATVFSFHPVKIITTGEGGAVLTKDDELAKSLRLLRSHGVTRDVSKAGIDQHGPWYYEQITLGYNYRMTDIQAALGRSQLKRIDHYIKKRNTLAQNYNKMLSNIPISLPKVNKNCLSSFHLYIIQLEGEQIPERRRAMYIRLHEMGIGVNVHYIPVHTQPFYQKLGFKLGDFPRAEEFYQKSLTIPLHVNLSKNEQSYIVSCIRDLLQMELLR